MLEIGDRSRCLKCGGGQAVTAETRAAEVLAEHRLRGRLGCTCRWFFRTSASDDAGMLAEHDAHVAAALSAAGCLRDDRPVHCMNCDADDLGCTACGAHGTLVAAWTRADHDARTDRLRPLADHLRVGHDVLPKERRYQDTWLHIALLAEEWFAARDDREGETVTAEQAWDEAAEAWAEWSASYMQGNNGPPDPPRNPYADMARGVLADREGETVTEWGASDRADVAAWLIREADQRVKFFPQRRDGVDAVMRGLAAMLRAPVTPDGGDH